MGYVPKVGGVENRTPDVEEKQVRVREARFLESLIRSDEPPEQSESPSSKRTDEDQPVEPRGERYRRNLVYKKSTDI